MLQFATSDTTIIRLDLALSKHYLDKTGSDLGDIQQAFLYAHDAHQRLGNIYMSLNDPGQAAVRFQQSLFYAKRNHDTLSILTQSGLLALAYNQSHLPEKALAVLEPALRLSPADAYTILVFLLANKIEAELALSNLNAAGISYNQMQIHIAGIGPNQNVMKYGLRSSIALLVSTRRYDEAEMQLKALHSLAENLHDPDLLCTTENLAFRIDSARGNIPSAIRHYQRFRSLSDSINRRNFDMDIDVLQIQYREETIIEELKRNAHELDLLTNESRLQTKSLQADALIRKLSLVVVGLVVILIGVIISRYLIEMRSIRLIGRSQKAIDAQNVELAALAAEQERLLREIHHRVKNNLQITISLLNSEMTLIADDEALNLIKDSQARMFTISLIHNRLYHSQNLGEIEMIGYLIDLCQFLTETSFPRRTIRVLVGGDPLYLDVEQAVLLGMITTEAVSNAQLYTCHEVKNDCTLQFQLDQDSIDTIVLTIFSKGHALTREPAPNNKHHLSRHDLMEFFAGQLNGEIVFQTTDAGSTIIIRFNITNKKQLTLPGRTNAV
ncbi:sensor histidine kinase [Niastella yeongjuensis]|nr:sensor histidine kinase [Niastella yeongjuensis]